MISIGSYLQDARPEQKSKTLERVTAMLMQGLAMHSYKHDEAEFEEFQNTIKKLRKQLSTAEDEETLFLSAGAAIHALERHNAAVERSLAEQRQETQNILGLMTQALLRVANGSADCTRNLSAIGNDFANAFKLNELRQLKEKLAQSLNNLCEETKRQQLQLSMLRSDLTTVAGHPDVRAILESSQLDPVTGLPNAECAAKAIITAWDAGVEAYLVLFAVDRIESVNLRFGFKAGDQMMRVFSEHVSRFLQPEDRLFRWRGSYFVGMLENRLPEQHMASEINKVANARLEHSIRVKDRDVMIPISASWTMFSLRSAPTVDDLLSKIADFLSNRSFPGAAPRRDR